MPVITVRISDEERKRLEKEGKLSEVVRAAIRFYLNSREVQKSIRKLRELQKRYKVKTTIEDELKLFREDRAR
jgi:Arc/MetJ-type ribon-helix-helix transcriptional regulator